MYRYFLCRRFAENSTCHGSLPACRFPTNSTLYAFANSGVGFFRPLYIEDAKRQVENTTASSSLPWLLGVSFWKLVPISNTVAFLNASRRFVSRRCQPTTMLSDNSKTFIGASGELKRCVNHLDNDKIYKAIAATNTTWKFWSSLWISFWRYLGAPDLDPEMLSIDHYKLQKIVAWCVQDNFGWDRSYIELQTTNDCRWPSKKWNAPHAKPFSDQ